MINFKFSLELHILRNQKYMKRYSSSVLLNRLKSNITQTNSYQNFKKYKIFKSQMKNRKKIFAFDRNKGNKKIAKLRTIFLRES